MKALLEPVGFPLERNPGKKRAAPPYRIVFVSPCWHRGGLESVTITHLRRMDRALFEPWIMTGDVLDMDDSLPAGVEMVVEHKAFEWQFPPLAVAFARARKAATEVLRRIAPDVVVGQLAHAPLFAANDLGVPVIIEYHHCGWSWDAQEHPSDAIVAVSNSTALRVHGNGRLPQVPVYLVYNGIDREAFRPLDPTVRRAVRARLGFAPEDLVVGFSGRFAAEKKPIEWVSALASIKQFREPRVRGLLVGPMWDREVYEATRDRAKKRGLTWASIEQDAEPTEEARTADLVHIHVSYEQMPLLYGAMHCLMHTRTEEPFGMIVPEALMCGVNVVAFAGGGIPEIFDVLGQPEYVSLCEPGDLDELASEVVGQLARGRVPEDFSREVGQRFGAERMAREFQEVVMQYLDARETLGTNPQGE